MYESLEGRVSSLEVVNVFLVDALATMIGVGIVDALGIVDGRASRTTGSVAIALQLPSATGDIRGGAHA